MAIFKYPPLASVHTTADSDHAFDSDSSGDDTLIVGAGVFLGAEGQFANGAQLGPNGAWTVTINGSIVSAQAVGIRLEIGNPNVSSITVGLDGQIKGGFTGVQLFSRATLTNAGIIAGGFTGVATGDFGPDVSARIIKNSGTITGTDASIWDVSGSQSACRDIVTNSGTLIGNVILGDLGSDVADKLTNTGRINGDVYLSSDAGSIFANSGRIFNDKVIGFDGSVTGGNGADTFTNYIVKGGVKKSGMVEGQFDLGFGDDLFRGGNNVELVRDSRGQDTYKLGGGNDEFRAFFRDQSPSDRFDADDIVYGGKGIDTYDASAAISGSFGEPGLVINLDSKSHTFDYRGVTITIGANRGNDIDLASPGGLSSAGDNILNFENIKGTGFEDVFFASSVANDFFGGSGADRFVFTNLKHSGPTAATRDTILDFSQGQGDKIDLSAMNTPGSPAALHFIGNNVDFNGDAGALRAYWTATGQIVALDINGDKKAEFSVEIVDANHAITFGNGDFIL